MKTEDGLKPLQEFQAACGEFEKWLEEVEEKMVSQMLAVCCVQELTQQTEACQVRACDLCLWWSVLVTLVMYDNPKLYKNL